MQLNLSVIIPAYNVERFIEKAIQSVLIQKEVTEIVVVDDGSTDATTQIVKELKLKNPIIKLLQHPNKANKGRSASRNLAIQKATGNYIAFLDADDYFLPNRFVNDFKIFKKNTNCDGVYNAIGVHFYDKATEENNELLKLYTVKHKIKSEELFRILFSGKKGHFSVDGFTVKKSVFDIVGFFNVDLKVAEDTDLLWKMALKCRLETGIIDSAVAIRGVHATNVFNNKVLYEEYYIKMLESVLFWASKNKIQHEFLDLLLKQIWILKQRDKNTLLCDIKYWNTLFIPNYQLLFSILSIKYFPVIRYRQMLFPFLYSK